MAEYLHEKWLLLIHQIPTKPAYFRVKIWRRLQSLGALAIKNSVYVIPNNDEALEDFQWVLREIVQGGGEASICAASFVDGLTDERLEAMFQAARDADYAQIIEEAKNLDDALSFPSAAITDQDTAGLQVALSRLKRRFSTVVAVDFFGASGHEPARALLEQLEARLKEAKEQCVTEKNQSETTNLDDLRQRTWVTRKGVQVDRIASAWLIRRFIDPDAQFKFASSKGYKPLAGEIRFDMFEGEFTHEGDLCTFEVLVHGFFADDQALEQMGKIIHDLDFKDGKFKTPETPGIGGLMEGLALVHKSDQVRLERGDAIFSDLYEYLRRH